MNRFFRTFPWCIIHLSAYSQTNDCDGLIQGVIQDIESHEPLPYATVKIANSGLGAITDENGVFRIENICEKEVHLEVHFMGYKPAIHHHDFHHPSPIIYLASEEIELESVVIEENKYEEFPQSITIKSKTIEFQETLGSSVGEILQGISGVSSFRTGQNVVKPIVHGLHSSRVLLINNGVQHAYQSWGQEHAPEIDLSQISRLTLVKGASTVRYGPEALGGVILFDPESPSYDQSLSAQIENGYKTNGRAYSGKVSLKQGFHRFAWNAGIYSTKQGDLQAPDYYLTNTGKREFSYYLSAKIHQARYDLDLFASSFRQKLGILRGSVVGNLTDLANAINSEPPGSTRAFSYEINTPNQETQHDLYKLKSSLFPGKHQIEIQYALQRNLRQEFDVRRGTNNLRPSINLELITHSLNIDWNYPAPNFINGSLGIQLFNQDNNNIPGTNTIPFVPNHNTTNIGVFTIQSIENGASTYELGFRYDYQFISSRGRDRSNDLYRNELNYNNVTFSLGYARQLNEELLFRTNLGSAWRPPKVGELYSFGKHQFTLEYGLWRHELFDNDSISTARVLDNRLKKVKSERGLKWIGAMEVNRSSVQAEFVPYVNYIQNYFFTRPYGITNTVRGPFPFFIYDQTDALFMGADLDVRIPHSPTLGSELKMAFVNARDVDHHQYFLEIPPLHINYSLSKRINHLTCSLSGEWTARQWNAPPVISPESFSGEIVQIDRSGAFDFIPPPRGYFLIHASAKFVKGKFKGSLKIENILNQPHRSYTDRLRYFSDDAGRNMSISISYRLSK